MSRRVLILLVSLSPCPLVSSTAQGAGPTVEAVLPAVGQRGSEFTLTLTGARLDGPQELMLYAPGVVCTGLAAKSENEVTATLKAAADCRLGEYAFRLRRPGGASELRTFRVTPFPVVAEKEPNDDPKQAQAVPLNVSVAAAMEAGGLDHFAVTLKKGQRLAAEVEGVRMGAEVTDTVITVFGPDGRELAANDDNPLFRQDSFVTLVAPEDGVYVVRVRETNGDGGDNARYVLHVGTFCRPGAVFPAGGQAGTEVAVKLLGDAAGERTQTLKLPAAGTPFEFYATDGDTPAAPTANLFRVSPFPNVTEAEPNDDPKTATANPHGWPVAFNGVIEKAGDADHFRFRAKAGDRIDVQAFAYRVGSPLDAVVAVLHPDGKLLAANDDDETHDSRVKVTIPADGEYLVRVTDKRRQGGPAFIYRVELTRPEPGLAVFLAPPVRKTQERQVVAVPRGNRVTAFLAVRRDGFTGPVTIAPGELPAGVKLVLNPVTANEYLVPVVFEAAADAPIGGKLVSLTGTTGGPDAPVRGGFAQVVTLVRGPGDSALHTVEVDRLAIVVVEEAPYTAAVVPPAAPLAADGTLDVVVKVTRAKDFAEPLEVSFTSLPPGVECPAVVIIPADKTEAVVTMVASPAAEPGEWKLAAEARVARPQRGGRDPLLVGNPDDCLIVNKATGKVPHTGGKRIEPGSEGYQLLLRWLEAGAPRDPADTPKPVGIEVYPKTIVFAAKGDSHHLPDGRSLNYFLTTFGRSTRNTACSCEVKTTPTLSQALHLLNGETTTGKIAEGGGAARLLKEKADANAVAAELYARCLGRSPTAAEAERIAARLDKAADKQAALEDLFWALLNTNEFIFNH